jgi:hypothetical protein
MRAQRIAIGENWFNTGEHLWEEVNGDGGELDYLADLVVEGNVGIGTTSPNASAILDVSSTTKALMLPRMTTAQKDAIASPAAGMLVYDTSAGSIYAHNGSTWVAQGSGSTCVVTYNSSVGSCSCPAGWTLKLDLGSWGSCSYSGGGHDFGRPPGGGCLSGWIGDNHGEGCLCCQ